MNKHQHGDFIKAQARRQRRLENRSLPGPKKHHYKEPEPMGRKNGIWVFRYLFVFSLRIGRAYTASELSLGWMESWRPSSYFIPSYYTTSEQARGIYSQMLSYRMR
jgi:hypothetical protein